MPPSLIAERPHQARSRAVALRATAVATVLLCCVVAAACGSAGTDDGTKLPDARLVDLHSGKAVGWGEGEGPLVINLWASWCSPCRAEMPAFERAHQRLGSRVSFLGVTDDPDRRAARTVAADTGVQYPLAVDTDERLLTDLRVVGLPATVFVDADGRIIGRHAGALTEAKLLHEIERLYAIRP